jgi:hypothetical protein
MVQVESTNWLWCIGMQHDLAHSITLEKQVSVLYIIVCIKNFIIFGLRFSVRLCWHFQIQIENRSCISELGKFDFCVILITAVINGRNHSDTRRGFGAVIQIWHIKHKHGTVAEAVTTSFALLLCFSFHGPWKLGCNQQKKTTKLLFQELW